MISHIHSSATPAAYLAGHNFNLNIIRSLASVSEASLLHSTSTVVRIRLTCSATGAWNSVGSKSSITDVGSLRGGVRGGAALIPIARAVKTRQMIDFIVANLRLNTYELKSCFEF
jgi:hypothetical protein